MLRTLAIIAAVLIAGLLVYAATKPDTFRVERSVRIKAPAEEIFPLINNLQRWKSWSPYEKKDPEMKKTFSGAEEGPGAVYAWEGNKDIGKGRMEVLESVPPSKVTIKLDFVEPFEAHNTAEFILVPDGEATAVTWALQGPSSYMSKLMSIFFDMNKMIGTDFEKGLTDLKAVAEGKSENKI